MIRQSIREAVILILLAVVFGTSYTFVTHRGLFAPPANASSRPSPISTIDVAAAKRGFDAGAALFIDARHSFEFSRRHIPHAVNIPLADADAAISRLDSVSRDRYLIVYCDGAECNSSMDVGVRLMQAGFTNVHVFFGGWEEWTGKGYPTERSAS